MHTEAALSILAISLGFVLPGCGMLFVPRRFIKALNTLNKRLGAKTALLNEGPLSSQKHLVGYRISGACFLFMGYYALINSLGHTAVSSRFESRQVGGENTQTRWPGMLFGLIAAIMLAIMAVSPPLAVRVFRWDKHMDPEYIAQPHFELTVRGVGILGLLFLASTLFWRS